MSFILTEKVVNFSMQQGTAMQIFEPYIWVFGDGTSILLISLILILLFADMPFLDGEVPYVLIRINTRIWILGQILYLVLSTIAYSLYILLTTSILCAAHAFVGNKWSPTAALLGYSRYSDILSIPAELKTFQVSHPYECTLHIFLLLLMYTIFSVLLMMLLTIIKDRRTGIIGVFMFHMLGTIFNTSFLSAVFHLNMKMMYKVYIVSGWVSPLNHATYYMHNFGYDMLPTIIQSYLIFGLGIVLISVAITWRMAGYSFNFMGSEVIND